MQINSCQNRALLMKSATKKVKETSQKNFSETVKNVNVSKTNETKKLSKAEEMVEFKKEIYAELEKIHSMQSSKVISDSIQITEDGFKRMKEDPKYREKIMNWLKDGARASHKLPSNSRGTITITGSGAYGYMIDDDMYRSDGLLRGQFREHSKKAFYSFDNTRNSQNKYNDRLRMQRRAEQIRLEKKEIKKKLDNEIYLKKMNSKHINRYIENSVFL